MAQVINEKVSNMFDSELAQSLKSKMNDTFDPIKDRIANTKVITSCLAGMSFGADEDNDENTVIDTVDENGEFAKMDRRVRDAVTKSFRCRGAERLDEDAETILTEALKNDDADTIFTEAFTTTDLNTLDENNSPFTSRHRPNNNGALGENKNTTNNNCGPTPRQSFKDKFVQMKKQQQFKPAGQQQRKPNLSVDASGAAEQYEAARRLKEQKRQERERFLQKMANNNKRVVEQTPSESPLAPQRQAIDP